MNKANAFPQFFIQLSRQGFHKGVIFLAEHFLPPLFYDLDLIAVCLFLIKSTDTFDNVIAFFGLYDIADFIRSQIKSRFLKFGVHLAFPKSVGALFPSL